MTTLCKRCYAYEGIIFSQDKWKYYCEKCVVIMDYELEQRKLKVNKEYDEIVNGPKNDYIRIPPE